MGLLDELLKRFRRRKPAPKPPPEPITASGHQTPQDVTGSWMRSSDHRANILGRDFLEVGFGVAKSREGTRYWAALFARPSTLAAAELAYCDTPEGLYG